MVKRGSENRSDGVFKLGRKVYQVSFDGRDFVVREDGRVICRAGTEMDYLARPKFDWRGERVY